MTAAALPASAIRVPSGTRGRVMANQRIPAMASEGVTPLMYACQQGQDRQVRSIILRKPGSVRERDRTGKTALHYCAENKQLHCIDQLIAAAPEIINSKDEEGYTALTLAVISGNKVVIKYLLGKGADITCLDNEKHSVVHWATVCGEADALDLLLETGTDPSTSDLHGAYPLHYAAQMYNGSQNDKNDSRTGMAVLKRLLNKGVPVDVTDQDGRQPLLWAASAGNGDAILSLVNAGANVEADDKDGLTALHCAASRGHTECVETLIALCGAEVDVLDSNGCTALFYAATLGHADSTQLLLSYGSEPNRQDRKGRTPAHCGAAKGQLETLKLLAMHGASLWVRNVKGDLPLHEAIQSGRKELVRWLLSQRPEASNAANNDGRCPLHIAAINNNVELCKILMDLQAQINTLWRTAKGQLMTPLDAALHRGNRGCAKYLQLHGGIPASKLSDNNALQKELNRNVINGAVQQSRDLGTESYLQLQGAREPGEGALDPSPTLLKSHPGSVVAASPVQDDSSQTEPTSTENKDVQVQMSLDGENEVEPELKELPDESESVEPVATETPTRWQRTHETNYVEVEVTEEDIERNGKRRIVKKKRRKVIGEVHEETTVGSDLDDEVSPGREVESRESEVTVKIMDDEDDDKETEPATSPWKDTPTKRQRRRSLIPRPAQSLSRQSQPDSTSRTPSSAMAVPRDSNLESSAAGILSVEPLEGGSTSRATESSVMLKDSGFSDHYNRGEDDSAGEAPRELEEDEEALATSVLRTEDNDIDEDAASDDATPEKELTGPRLKKRGIKDRKRASTSLPAESDSDVEKEDTKTAVDSSSSRKPRARTKFSIPQGSNGIRDSSDSKSPATRKASEDKEKRKLAVDKPSPISVTQAVQNSMRKYQLERRIFQELLELKRLQIRAGRANEQVLVKRMVDAYKKAGLIVYLKSYDGPFTFKGFEKYLYDQLRLLQNSSRKLIPKFKESDDLDKLSQALKKFNAAEMNGFLSEPPQDPTYCTRTTHRCHHAAHAYTGVPCAAYITKYQKSPIFQRRSDSTTNQSPNRSFLPKIDANGTTGLIGNSSKAPLRSIKPGVTLELTKSDGKQQVVTLPAENLQRNKKYYVTLTVKPNFNSPALNKDETKTFKSSDRDSSRPVTKLEIHQETSGGLSQTLTVEEGNKIDTNSHRHAKSF